MAEGQNGIQVRVPAAFRQAAAWVQRQRLVQQARQYWNQHQADQAKIVLCAGFTGINLLGGGLCYLAGGASSVSLAWPVMAIAAAAGAIYLSSRHEGPNPVIAQVGGNQRDFWQKQQMFAGLKMAVSFVSTSSASLYLLYFGRLSADGATGLMATILSPTAKTLACVVLPFAGKALLQSGQNLQHATNQLEALDVR